MLSHLLCDGSLVRKSADGIARAAPRPAQWLHLLGSIQRAAAAAAARAGAGAATRWERGAPRAAPCLPDAKAGRCGAAGPCEFPSGPHAASCTEDVEGGQEGGGGSGGWRPRGSRGRAPRGHGVIVRKEGRAPSPEGPAPQQELSRLRKRCGSGEPRSSASHARRRQPGEGEQ